MEEKLGAHNSADTVEKGQEEAKLDHRLRQLQQYGRHDSRDEFDLVLAKIVEIKEKQRKIKC